MEVPMIRPHIQSMEENLSGLRQQIDALDGELVQLLARREKLVQQVLVVKRANNIPARIKSRVDQVINNAASRAEALGANPDLARAVWTPMVDWFCDHEERELAKG
jgi:isochorismate pyruvate lyase